MNNKVVVFYAHTESGDQYLQLLPKKLNSKEFSKFCKSEYPYDFEAETLNGKQIELTLGNGVQL